MSDLILAHPCTSLASVVCVLISWCPDVCRTAQQNVNIKKLEIELSSLREALDKETEKRKEVLGRAVEALQYVNTGELVEWRGDRDIDTLMQAFSKWYHGVYEHSPSDSHTGDDIRENKNDANENENENENENDNKNGNRNGPDPDAVTVNGFDDIQDESAIGVRSDHDAD